MFREGISRWQFDDKFPPLDGMEAMETMGLLSLLVVFLAFAVGGGREWFGPMEV